MKKLLLFPICALVFAAITSGVPAQRPDLSGPARVIDGDTIAIRGWRIRIHGIDAPEARQTCTDARKRPYPCGSVSTKILSTTISSRPVRCVIRDTDRHGRPIGQCFAAGDDIGAVQVRLGMALAYRQYSHAYVTEEARARDAGVGIWSGTFEFPWNWRRQNR